MVGPAGYFISQRYVPPSISAFEYSMLMFPKSHPEAIKAKKNEILESRGLSPTSCGKILRFLGVPILITCLEFSDRRDV